MKYLMLLLLSMVSLAVSESCHSVEPERPSFSCGSDLSCGQIKDLTDSALNGSSSAAQELFLLSFENGSREEAMYWARISMENGSSVGRRNYASFLSEENDFRSLARARYHLKILVDQGHMDAAVLLGIVERKLAEAK